MMDALQLEALFKFQGFQMEQSLLDDLFRDAPLYIIDVQKDDADYVEVRLTLEGFPWRPQCTRVLLVSWRGFTIVKLGNEYGISRSDRGFAWSRSARQVTDWAIAGKV